MSDHISKKKCLWLIGYPSVPSPESALVPINAFHYVYCFEEDIVHCLHASNLRVFFFFFCLH